MTEKFKVGDLVRLKRRRGHELRTASLCGPSLGAGGVGLVLDIVRDTLFGQPKDYFAVLQADGQSSEWAEWELEKVEG